MSEFLAPEDRRGTVDAQQKTRAGDLRGEQGRYPDPTLRDTTSKQLEEMLDLLVRRRWTLIATWLVIVAVVAAYTFTRTPEYEADSFIMVDLDQIGSLAGDVNVNGRTVATSSRLATELFILETSRQIEQRVRKQLLEREGVEENSGDARPRALIDGRVRVAPASRDVANAIRVTAVSPSPETAALLANLYTDEYIRLSREANRTSLSVRRSTMEDLVGLRQQELWEAEEKVKAYVIQKGAVGLDQETSRMVSSVAQLESRRDDARIDLRMRQASLETTERELEEINPQLVRRFSSNLDGRMESVHRKLNELQLKREQILLRNPTLEEGANEDLGPIDEQISGLQQKLESLSSEYVDEVIAAGGISNNESGLSNVVDLKKQIIADRISIDGLESKIQMMESHLAQYQRELGNVPAVSLDLARLERDRVYAQEQYQSLQQQLDQARLAEESQPGYASVIREAREPSRPVSPNIPRNLALGLILGMVSGLGIAITRDKLDNRINKPDQLKKLGYSILGVVPDLRPFIKSNFSGSSVTKKNDHPISTSLVSFLDPIEPASEAFRHIRTNVQFSLPDKIIRSLLVTSPSSGDGKSTVAANLAVVLAQSGRKTLLIDADLRRPQQHRLFCYKRGPGLVEMLFSQSGIKGGALKTGIENLSLITAGGNVKSGGQSGLQSGDSGDQVEVPNPAELLGSRRMREALEELRETYDVIIIDSPPVLSATDAVLLSTQCDATVMVTRAGKTKEGELDYSQEVLRDVGATVIGTLLNGFDIKMAYGMTYTYGSNAYGYYGKYGYGYTDEGRKGTPRRSRQ